MVDDIRNEYYHASSLQDREDSKRRPTKKPSAHSIRNPSYHQPHRPPESNSHQQFTIPPRFQTPQNETPSDLQPPQPQTTNHSLPESSQPVPSHHPHEKKKRHTPLPPPHSISFALFPRLASISPAHSRPCIAVPSTFPQPTPSFPPTSPHITPSSGSPAPSLAPNNRSSPETQIKPRRVVGWPDSRKDADSGHFRYSERICWGFVSYLYACESFDSSIRASRIADVVLCCVTCLQSSPVPSSPGSPTRETKSAATPPSHPTLSHLYPSLQRQDTVLRIPLSYPDLTRRVCYRLRPRGRVSSESK